MFFFAFIVNIFFANFNFMYYHLQNHNFMYLQSSIKSFLEVEKFEYHSAGQPSNSWHQSFLFSAHWKRATIFFALNAICNKQVLCVQNKTIIFCCPFHHWQTTFHLAWRHQPILLFLFGIFSNCQCRNGVFHACIWRAKDQATARVGPKQNCHSADAKCHRAPQLSSGAQRWLELGANRLSILGICQLDGNSPPCHWHGHLAPTMDGVCVFIRWWSRRCLPSAALVACPSRPSHFHQLPENDISGWAGYNPIPSRRCHWRGFHGKACVVVLVACWPSCCCCGGPQSNCAE